MTQRILALAIIAALGAVTLFFPRSATPVVAADTKADAAAVERAKAEVKKLDDLYKTAVVGITKTYVDKQSDVPAAAVAKALFEAMHKKGYHSAKLLDATGKPKNKENVAKTDFEKKAVAAIQGGKEYVEECAETDGKPVYRAATIVPAVMKQCVLCHGGKEGALMGVLVYEVPIK